MASRGEDVSDGAGDGGGDDVPEPFRTLAEEGLTDFGAALGGTALFFVFSILLTPHPDKQFLQIRIGAALVVQPLEVQPGRAETTIIIHEDAYVAELFPDQAPHILEFVSHGALGSVRKGGVISAMLCRCMSG